MPKRSLLNKKNSYKKPADRAISQESTASELQSIHHDVNLVSKQALAAIENNYKQILEMQDRILSAPAMNGGFTTLLYKVENIEQTQSQIVEKVDQIHDVLYEPDTGLYARIKNVENASISPEILNHLEKDLQEIKIWKFSKEKLSEKYDEHETQQSKIIQDHDVLLKQVHDSIKKYNAAIKWIVVSMSGGIVSIAIKLIYDYLSGHIKIV